MFSHHLIHIFAISARLKVLVFLNGVNKVLSQRFYGHVYTTLSPTRPKPNYFTRQPPTKSTSMSTQRFADAIIANHQEGDIIWVNDYHLLLLPTLLRLSPKIPASTPIGFFMHVAFPSSEIFRCLSVRKDLLRGMLGADVVGFQTANYARHWRQTVSRILSFEALPRGIQVPEGEGLTLPEMREIEHLKEGGNLAQRRG